MLRIARPVPSEAWAEKEELAREPADTSASVGAIVLATMPVANNKTANVPAIKHITKRFISTYSSVSETVMSHEHVALSNNLARQHSVYTISFICQGDIGSNRIGSCQPL